MPTTLQDAEVDAEIGQDWKEILKGQTEEVADDEPPEPEVEAEQPAKPAEAQAADESATADDVARDKKGRFKERRYKPEKPAAVAKPEAEEPPEKQQQAQEPTDGQPPHPQAQQRDITRAPASWKPTARAAWANLPEPVRAEIHRREADFMAGQAQLVTEARFGSEMTKAIDPYRMLIESEGGTPAQAVTELLRTVAVLRTGTPQQKYGTMLNIAQRYGLDPRIFAQRPQQQVGPNGQPVPQQVQPQQQFRDPRVDTLLANMQTQEQQRVIAEQRNTENTVNRWMNETDAQGNPMRPYIGDVIDEMSALIPSLQAADPTLTHQQALELAYERATWGNPEIRVLLQQQQQTAADARRRSENQQRAASARRGASVNVPRRGALPPKPITGSIEETIANEARKLGLIST